MSTRLACIGCGNMGGAILRGLSGLEGFELYGMDSDLDRLQALCAECGATPLESLKELVNNVDYLMLAVKPQHMETLLHDLAPRLRPGQTLVSIAAGLTLRTLKRYSSGVCPVVRVMPNTPAMVQEGMFAVCFDDPDLKEEQKEAVRTIFTTLGRVFELEEKYFDAYTAVAGSGPAYVFYFMDALVEAAVTQGLTRAQGAEMAVALFKGASKLAEVSPDHLCELREMVTSPGGVTVAASNVLDAKAVRAAIVEAVAAACARSKELGGE